MPGIKRDSVEVKVGGENLGKWGNEEKKRQKQGDSEMETKAA